MRFRDIAMIGQVAIPLTGDRVVMWLQASKLGLSNGAVVGQWDDLSGNGNHAVQSSGSTQPIYRSSIAGFPCVEFDNTDDCMVSSLFLTKPLTVIAVYAPISTSGTHRVIQGGTDTYLGYSGGIHKTKASVGSAAVGSLAAGAGTKVIHSLKTNLSGYYHKVVGATIDDVSSSGGNDMWTINLGASGFLTSEPANAYLYELKIWNYELDSTAHAAEIAALRAAYGL